jgi:hypothetical protein
MGPDGPAVASLTISPDAGRLSGFGRQLHATATARDAAGNVVLAEVTWGLDDYSVASVSECGIILALSEGTTDITARAGAVADTAFLIVDFPDTAAEAWSVGGPRASAPNRAEPSAAVTD